MEQAPHLPDKNQNEDVARVDHMSFKYIVLILVISILSGAAAALTIEAWLLPIGYGGAQISIERSSSSKKQQEQELSQIKQQQLEQRLVAIYDNKKLVNGKYYPQGAKVATAAMLSSNGWSVLTKPNFAITQVQDWQAADNQGKLRDILKVRRDSKSGLIYIKLEGSGYRVNSIASWDNTSDRFKLWGKHKDWSQWQLSKKDKPDTARSSITNPQEYYEARSNPDKSLPLFNKGGKLAGVLGNNGELIPSWYVSAQMNNILSDKKITYNFPNITGVFLTQKVSQDNMEPTQGFLVQEYTNSGKIRKGDVIVEVDGRKINKENAARIIHNLSYPLEVRLLRNETVIEIKLRGTPN